ncbi:MAG TPA: hypothetical protein VNE38_12045 [Ktedonobacteraceae bacterium]|nr:hypothetical protein [Ktedonobacteraceae bacterium]
MQVVCPPKGKVAQAYVTTTRDAEIIRYFTLQGALPEGQTLVMNSALGTLSLLSNGEILPRLLIQQQFTASELSLLLPLLEQFPHFCPYDVMFASFYNGAVTEATIEHCRRQLEDALEAGCWDQQLRPVRNVLSRIRFKLRGFGLDIVSILETGYILMMTNKAKAH